MSNKLSWYYFKMEILYLYRGKDDSHLFVKTFKDKHAVRAIEGPLHKKISSLSPKQTANVKILVLFVDSLVTKESLARFPKLKFIATRSTGIDHIDVEACNGRGIKIANVPGYGSASVGELALTLLLGLSRGIKQSILNTQKGIFDYRPNFGFELRGKTIGIVGTGIIGSYVAELAHGMRMKVKLFDLKPNQQLAKKVQGEYMGDLKKMLPSVDILSLHVPMNPQTRHLISYEELIAMKRGSVIINTSRGGIIYAPALLESIENGHLFGAGIDVLELEQYLFTTKAHPKTPEHRSIIAANRKLMHHPQVLHTLHLGAQTLEAHTKIYDETINNVNAFLDKRQINLANQP